MSEVTPRPPRRFDMLEDIIERAVFSSRWLLAPIYLGLVASLFIVVIKFIQQFWYLAQHTLDLDERGVTVGVLGLIDATLVANLVMIVILAGYENFVSRMRVAEMSEDKPRWLGKVDYGGLKIKLIGSLVAISVIELLKDFLSEQGFDSHTEGWRVGLHLTFVLSGLLFAVMDRIAEGKED